MHLQEKLSEPAIQGREKVWRLQSGSHRAQCTAAGHVGCLQETASSRDGRTAPEPCPLGRLRPPARPAELTTTSSLRTDSQRATHGPTCPCRLQLQPPQLGQGGQPKAMSGCSSHLTQRLGHSGDTAGFGAAAQNQCGGEKEEESQDSSFQEKWACSAMVPVLGHWFEGRVVTEPHHRAGALLLDSRSSSTSDLGF